jgi:hypothetical protein
MVVQIEVVNGKIEWVDRRRKITGGWMTNDSTFKDGKKKKKEKCIINFIRLWERGDCRKCEDISQGEHKRKKYAEEIF